MKLWKIVLGIALALPGIATSQAYPSKPVRVVIPYPPGSTPDLVGRTVSDRLQKALGQPFVVENRTGAAGNIGTDAVAKSAPDPRNGPASSASAAQRPTDRERIFVANR
jgi:tripartite-type tricarboxylate transporter receptor subunit TctC